MKVETITIGESDAPGPSTVSAVAGKGLEETATSTPRAHVRAARSPLIEAEVLETSAQAGPSRDGRW
jgi:hypothetical protein